MFDPPLQKGPGVQDNLGRAADPRGDAIAGAQSLFDANPAPVQEF